MGEKQRLSAHARGGQRRLSAGMAAADDNHLEACWEQHDFIEY
jgi:hypothetical protein